jgi:phasin
MPNTSEFEVPDSLRELTQKSVDQARKAYEQFLEQSRKAQDMVAHSSAAMGATARDVQSKAMQFTEENMRSGFELAGRLAKAKSVAEALELQSEFARRQMETYARQAQELTGLVAKASQTGSGKA